MEKVVLRSVSGEARDPWEEAGADDHKKAAQLQAASLGEVLSGLGKQFPLDRNLRSGSLIFSYAFCEPIVVLAVAEGMLVVR